MKAYPCVIDCDVHQSWPGNELQDRLSREFPHEEWQLPAALLASPLGSVMRDDATPEEGGGAGSSARKMIEQHLAPFDIGAVVLTGSGAIGLGIHPNVHYGNAMARAYNELLAETWLQTDDRFYGSIVINPQDPIEAAREIRRWADHPRMVQTLMCSGARIPYGHKMYWPIYEAAAECGLPVAVHPGTEDRGVANGFIAGSPSSYLEWHTNIPQNYMGHMVSLLCEGVFEKFPRLKFVLIEGGLAWIPGVLWRLDKNWKALRSTVPWLRRLPSEYAIEHVRFTTQPIEEPENPAHLQALLEMIHAEKTVMFSSDYPHWDNDSPKHGLPRLDPELMGRIFYHNAFELYDFTRAGSLAAKADPVGV